MSFSRDAFKQWVEQNTPPATEESRRWWAQIMAQVVGQTRSRWSLDAKRGRQSRSEMRRYAASA
jgi:hypothetical protein